MKKVTNNDNRLFEYRIKYNADHMNSAMDNYHYYMATTALQALEFHSLTMERKKAYAQDLSVERYNPWTDQWEDKSKVLQDHEN